MASGLMLVLSAPSGTGKTTLARRLVAACDGIFSVSATTRAPRGAERPGVDYEFVDAAEFQRRIDARELLEWAEVHGNRYGTPRRFAGEAAGGRLVVFDIDVQGGRQIKAQRPEAAAVFVLPPSLEELERRLRGRGTDADAVIARRLAAASAEICFAAPWLRSASFFTSEATTAKPRPCSPARAASIAAFSERRFVW
jgi:guanylate kinase